MSQFIFRQLIPSRFHRIFDMIVAKYNGDRYVKDFTCWNLLLVLIFAQLSGCDSLREFICLAQAHCKKGKHLGFGDGLLAKSTVADALTKRNWHIYEEFAYRLVAIAQECRIGRPFELQGKFYAFDSTTIELCLNLFQWANFRKKKGGIKMHTMFDVVTQIPVFFHITDAKVADVNAMDLIEYQKRAFYIFDRGYYDWERYYTINQLEAFYVTRQRKNIQFEIVDMDDVLENEDNIVFDQRIRFTEDKTKAKYPGVLRRVGYYDEEKKHVFIFLTNNLEISAKQVALLYKNRWQVELFFKWIKQHLRVKTFWGTNENAVRIQLYTAISAYCLIAIAEHEYGLDRSMFDVLRVVSRSLMEKMPIAELFAGIEPDASETEQNDKDQFMDSQLALNFDWAEVDDY